MANVVRSITSPKKFISGQNLLSSLNDYIKDYGDKAFVICDEFILENFKRRQALQLKQLVTKWSSRNSNMNVQKKRLIVTANWCVNMVRTLS